VKFEDTLEVQQVVLKSLAQCGKYEECISKGIDILRILDFYVVISPTIENIMNAVKSIDILASQYSIEYMMNLCESDVGDSIKNIAKIMQSFYVACYATTSPVLPLIACAMIKYSLENGICEESTFAFATFAILKINLEGNYTDAQQWAQVSRGIIKKYQSMKKSNVLHEIQAGFMLCSTVDIWFTSPREVCQLLLKYYHDAMRIGHIELAMHSLVRTWTFRLFSGDNLHMIALSTRYHLKRVADQQSKHYAIYVALNNILLMELTGKSVDCFSVFAGSISNMIDVLAEAVNSKDDHQIHTTHGYIVMLAYWRGDYLVVEETSRIAALLPTKVPQVLFLVHLTLFRGLVAFRLYRKFGDDQRLAEGKEMIDKMEKWALNSKAVFENKLLMLKAEYLASIREYDKALDMYTQSIQLAQDHGRIDELGLAYELLGNVYSSAHAFKEDPNNSFKMAHLYFTQWGATAVAARLVRENDLDMTSMDINEAESTNTKYS